MSMTATAAEGGPNSEHLVGPEGVFSGYLEPESGRYVMYVAAGCPFAARPWFLVKYYGLEDAIQIVRTFPGNGDDGWFLKPKSEWEKTIVEGNSDAFVDTDPVDDVSHMRDFYAAKAPEYDGKITVPVLFDKKTGKIISTDSMSMAKALCGKGMRAARTRNKDVELLPSADDAAATEAMNKLVNELSAEVTSKVYKIHGSPTQAEHNKLTEELFATFGKLDKMLADSNADSAKQFLVGGKMSFADTILFHTAIRFELGYRWRFNIGGDSLIDKYPAVWNLVTRFMAIEGISGKGGSVLPKDITRFFWTSASLAKMGAVKTPVPTLPTMFTPTGLA